MDEEIKKLPTAIEMAQWIKANEYTILGPRVGIFRDESPTVSKGGILLPDTSRGRLQKKTGTIVALGKHIETDYIDFLKLGARVIFGKYEAMEFYVDINGTEYIIDLLHQHDVYFTRPATNEEEWLVL